MSAPTALPMWVATTEPGSAHQLRVTLEDSDGRVKLALTDQVTGGRFGLELFPHEAGDLYAALGRWLEFNTAASCARHYAVDRRDGRGPWCVDCGRDAVGQQVVDNCIQRGES